MNNIIMAYSKFPTLITVFAGIGFASLGLLLQTLFSDRLEVHPAISLTGAVAGFGNVLVLIEAAKENK